MREELDWVRDDYLGMFAARVVGSAPPPRPVPLAGLIGYGLAHHIPILFLFLAVAYLLAILRADLAGLSVPLVMGVGYLAAYLVRQLRHVRLALRDGRLDRAQVESVRYQRGLASGRWHTVDDVTAGRKFQVRRSWAGWIKPGWEIDVLVKPGRGAVWLALLPGEDSVREQGIRPRAAPFRLSPGWLALATGLCMVLLFVTWLEIDAEDETAHTFFVAPLCSGRELQGCVAEWPAAVVDKRQAWLGRSPQRYLRLRLPQGSAAEYRADRYGDGGLYTRLAVGDTVTAAVWEGRVVEVRDDAGRWLALVGHPAYPPTNSRGRALVTALAGLVCAGAALLRRRERRQYRRWAAAHP